MESRLKADSHQRQIGSHGTDQGLLTGPDAYSPLAGALGLCFENISTVISQQVPSHVVVTQRLAQNVG
ncbi:hypothetical protein Bpfe_030093 [Biomphalaria pfeifferi]|uniref:Uncharacterized protein n=1 Tax=Biomphalaria pfeifferi TaxID=112525 RepID=A0AAD8AQH0_BIOPF|nr:hypothetical protein Bpfe_030093 [Biomphalaria pfeifferi]